MVGANDEIKIASLTSRIFAFILDTIAMTIISVLIVPRAITLLLIILVVLFGIDARAFFIGNNSFYFVIVAFLSYFPFLEHFYDGTTVGRKIMRIRLVGYTERENKITLNYERLSFFKLLSRGFIKLFWYVPILCIPAFILMAEDKLHRVVYDKFFKTVVIRA